jgi:signal transduction histidine kinase
MLLGETVVGIIDIESPRPLAFSPLEMQVVEAYGRMAASALANLALMVSIRAKTTEEMKAALVSLTVHELTSPLNRVALDIERCEMLVEEARVDQLRDRLATAGATVKEATRRVREAVELAAKGNLISAEEVDLQALLQDVVHGARNATQGVRVELTNASNEVVFVRSNSHGLKLVVKELIANAEKACISAGRPDGTVRIHIKSSGNRICVFFADNGPGIPGEISTRLFKQPETASKGGFGLYKCRAMMQLHDGTLSLHKNSSAGATFKLAFLKVCAS